jgi:hypothetical protein
MRSAVLVPVLLLLPVEPGPASAPASAPAPEAIETSAGRAWVLAPLFRARIVSGAEWDSNAYRAVSGGTFGAPPGPEQVVGDAVARLLLDTGLSLQLTPKDRVDLGYVLGAKRFFSESREDLLVHEISVASAHALAGPLDLETFGTLRASRIRSGLRDYTLALAGAGLALDLTEGLTARGSASYVAFDFPAEERLAYAGPSVGAGLDWAPNARLSLSARSDFAWRAFRGNAPQVVDSVDPNGQPNQVLTYCDGSDSIAPPACTPKRHDGTELSLRARAAYRAGWVLGGEALARFQRSNSEFESLDRYRLSLFATFGLPAELVLNLLGALQFNQGLSVSQATYQRLLDDDLNFNRLEVQLSRRVAADLDLEVRYSLYANEFDAPNRYFRQTLFGGLSYAIEAH